MIQPQLEYVRNRIRKQVRYSALVTMTMRLLKKHNIFKLGERIAKDAQVKNQKNYSIICLRLCLLYSHLVHTCNKTKQQTIDYLFQYLRTNLRKVLDSKIFETEQKINRELFVNMGQQTIIRNLQIFRRALQADLNNYQQIKNIVQQLYEPTKNGKYSKQQIVSLNSLTSIFVKYSQKIEENIQQNDQYNSSQITPNVKGNAITDAQIQDKQNQKQQKSNNDGKDMNYVKIQENIQPLLTMSANSNRKQIIIIQYTNN